jgi:hypothetical protein
VSARIGNVLLVCGAAAIVAAGAWWWLTYGEVIRYNYISAQEAALCLTGDSEICRLARALCRGDHPTTFAAYRASLLWAGFLAVSLAAFMPRGLTIGRTSIEP